MTLVSASMALLCVDCRPSIAVRLSAIASKSGRVSGRVSQHWLTRNKRVSWSLRISSTGEHASWTDPQCVTETDRQRQFDRCVAMSGSELAHGGHEPDELSHPAWHILWPHHTLSQYRTSLSTARVARELHHSPYAVSVPHTAAPAYATSVPQAAAVSGAASVPTTAAPPYTPSAPVHHTAPHPTTNFTEPDSP